MAEILLPVGRMVGGSMYIKQQRTDNFGKPILGSDGQPETYYAFGVAIPKTPGVHWQQEPWGSQIKVVGDAAWPGQSLAPTFAWKITDGDSVIPNKKNRRPCDQEGYPGNWVLWFNQSWAPKICNANGSQEITDKDAVLPGYYVQVLCSVKGNAPSPSPGVYLNPLAVALSAYGPRIETSGVDTTTVGFGNTPLPAGASLTPVGAMAQQPTQQAANLQAAYQQPTQQAAPPPVPNQAFVQIPPAAPRHVMTPAAQGATYEQMIGAGWTDALLVQHGMMLP